MRDGDVAAAGDGADDVFAVAGFVADGEKVGHDALGGNELLPGSVGRAAVDDDDVEGCEGLRLHGGEQAADGLRFIEDGGNNRDGRHC